MIFDLGDLLNHAPNLVQCEIQRVPSSWTTSGRLCDHALEKAELLSGYVLVKFFKRRKIEVLRSLEKSLQARHTPERITHSRVEKVRHTKDIAKGRKPLCGTGEVGTRIGRHRNNSVLGDAKVLDHRLKGLDKFGDD